MVQIERNGTKRYVTNGVAQQLLKAGWHVVGSGASEPTPRLPKDEDAGNTNIELPGASDGNVGGENEDEGEEDNGQDLNEQLKAMDIDEIRAYAAEHEIDIDGLTKKKDIRLAILSATALGYLYEFHKKGMSL
jgi:hypothetical protein